MDTALLLLADSRLPAGGHAHSGGLEPAVTDGAVKDVAGLAAFLRGRLATSGLVTAALAAAACAHARDGGQEWRVLDAEADARTPSPAQRRASRAQGRSLLRAARSTWPHPALTALGSVSSGGGPPDPQGSTQTPVVPGGGPPHPQGSTQTPRAASGGRPHHPLVLGAATAAANGTPLEAATIAAYGSVTGPASAAVRLLGLDPLAVHRALAGLAAAADAVAAEAAASATGAWADLPAASAPVLDLYAELHIRADLRLFES